MRRICIFAHYDKDNIVDDYVLYYIKEISKIAEKVVFVSDSSLSQKEIDKIKKYTNNISTKKHGKYDFGSYQMGFKLIQNELNEYDELIMCNDSCYGPLFPLSKIFGEMDLKVCDFWGLTQNDDKLKGKVMPAHLQSYFLVFKKSVFTSETFKNFFDSIKKEEKKTDIIEKYEVGLSSTLNKYGFKFDSYINHQEGLSNQTIHHWQTIINQGFPFLKIGLIKYPPKKVDVSNWQKVINITNYPIELIEKHLKRVKDFKSVRRHLLSQLYNFFKKGK